MKKLISLISVLLLTFALSGCAKELSTQEQVEDGRICQLLQQGIVKTTYNCDDYYTQDQVDELLREGHTEILTLIMENYIQSYDDKLYTNCRIEESIKVCDEIILANDYYTTAQVDSFLQVFWDYINEQYSNEDIEYAFEEVGETLTEYDDRLDVIEDGDIDRQVVLYTLAIINIEIMAYDLLEAPTEEETAVYNMMLLIYDMIENEVD